MLDDLKNRKSAVAVIGLGYVGLPLAIELSRVFDVIGFDVNAQKVGLLKAGKSPNGDFREFEKDLKKVHFTTDPSDMKRASFFIVAVPTEVDEHKVPDLMPLKSASKMVGQCMPKGGIVVYESTTYPGCTDDDCIPIVERESGLKRGVDFGFGYSPERINPGDKEHTVRNILKIISGNTKEVLDDIEAVYATVVDAGLYRASSIKVAEAAKVIENTQRDLNISLMNELSMLFDRMGVDTYEVIKAAGTKWNFLQFKPGLVGGHCISVDPHYLIHKSKQLGYEPEVILSGRRVNDFMPLFIGRKIVQTITAQGKNLSQCKALVLGVTFKENVADIRNSRVFDLVEELENFSVKTTVHDPYAEKDEVEARHGVQLEGDYWGVYDVVVLAVSHNIYASQGAKHFHTILKDNAVFFDLKAVFEKSDFEGYKYMRL